MFKYAKGIAALAAVLVVNGCSGSPEAKPDTVIIGVNYIGASVSNLENSADLYGTAVGLQSVEQSDISESALFDALAGRAGIAVQTQMMRSVNAQVRFMAFANPSAEASATAPMDVQGPGIAHVCYQVNKDTGAYQKILAGGATHIGQKEMAVLNPKNPVKYAYVRDPDGLISEVEHVDISKLDLPEPPKNKYRIRHVSLATPDIDRSVNFYAVFLNQPSPRRVGTWWPISSENIDKVSGLKDSEVEMAWFQIRNLELEIFQYHSHPTTTPTVPRPIDALGYNMIVFDVANMQEARKRLIDAGGTIVTEPMSADDGEIMFGRDPDGNLLGLQSAPSTAIVSAQNFKDNGT